MIWTFWTRKKNPMMIHVEGLREAGTHTPHGGGGWKIWASDWGRFDAGIFRHPLVIPNISRISERFGDVFFDITINVLQDMKQLAFSGKKVRKVHSSAAEDPEASSLLKQQPSLRQRLRQLVSLHFCVTISSVGRVWSQQSAIEIQQSKQKTTLDPDFYKSAALWPKQRILSDVCLRS